MAYTIDATSCYLNVKDNNSDTFYSFRLGELTSYYDDSNFTITDDVRHIQIPIAEVSTINTGAFTTFADLQTFIRNAQIVCNNQLENIGKQVSDASTATLDDSMLVPIVDGVNLLKSTLASIKAFFKTYFDTLYLSKTSLLLPVINVGIDGATVSGTIANTVTYALPISENLLENNTALEFVAKIEKTGSVGNMTVRAYLNTTPDLTGTPIQIFQSAVLSITTRVACPQRWINVIDKNGTGNGTKISSLSYTGLSDTGNSSTNALINVYPDFSVIQYLILSIQLGSASDSAKGISLKLRP